MSLPMFETASWDYVGLDTTHDFLDSQSQTEIKLAYLVQ